MRVSVLLALALLTGCTAMPVSQSLGEQRDKECSMSCDNGHERLVSAFVLRQLPELNAARGFEVQLPDDLKRVSLVGVEKEFSTFAGESIHLVRKAFQGDASDGQPLSVLVSGDYGFVFSSREIRGVTVRSPNGKAFSLEVLRELPPEEVSRAYQLVARDFPWTSGPIQGNGTRYHFGEEAVKALNVPQTVTFSERAAVSKLGTVVLTDPVGMAISKAVALYRAATLSPTEGSLASDSEENTLPSSDGEIK